MSKPSVNVNPVANQYTERDERIIEFSSSAGGGLIGLKVMDDGTLRVDVYRCDPTVSVAVSAENLTYPPASAFETLADYTQRARIRAGKD